MLMILSSFELERRRALYFMMKTWVKYDCKIVNSAFMNQYKPTPEADIAVKMAITTEKMICQRCVFLYCSAPRWEIVRALRFRFRAQYCGRRCDTNCTGITSSKKNKYTQPCWPGPVSVKWLKTIDIGVCDKSQMLNKTVALIGRIVDTTR